MKITKFFLPIIARQSLSGIDVKGSNIKKKDELKVLMKRKPIYNLADGGCMTEPL